MLAYQPYREWPLPHDDLGNILARDMKIVLPEGWHFADSRSYVFDVIGIPLRVA